MAAFADPAGRVIVRMDLRGLDCRHTSIGPSHIEFLKKGTPRQREAYETLVRLGVFTSLARYTPTLTGTIPIDVDIEASDLDIICEAHDLNVFEREVARLYGEFPGFEAHRAESTGAPASVINFVADRFPIQLFAQPIPVTRQKAYRHMIAEARLLRLAGSVAKEAIRVLKRRGIKTEPAFAHYFGLPGDPYETLYQLADASEAQLREIIRRAPGIVDGEAFLQ